ncbi:MAG: hypothetical protein H7096_09775 [Flavobacterium sp.]|nr:hypothetical protein [Pedobacter sp.]
MKYLFSVFVFASILAVSCNGSLNKTKVTAASDSPKSDINKVMIPASTCYSSAIGKDTFKLKVETFPNVVTGRLSYNFSEKDSNEGDIEGKFNGDTLLADYKFMSEGKESTRQVIFLIRDHVATEGYGDMEEKAGMMVFKNIKNVNFGKGLILNQAECGEY